MKNTKRKHLKLCLLLLFMVLGCFAITNVRTTTVQASSRTFKSNGRTYMEKHNDNTLKYDREPFTVEEEKLRKEAVQELLIYQG